jgi:MFS family permease
MIGANVGGLVGSLIGLIHYGNSPNFYFLIAGRFLYPFSAGMLLVAIPRFIDENLPPALAGPWGTSTNIFMNIGIMICLFLGAGIPDDNLS